MRATRASCGRSPQRMRNWLAVAAVILGVATAPAFADRDHDPNSGAPLPPQRHETPSPITDHFYIRGTFYDPQVRTNFRVIESAANVDRKSTRLNSSH